MSTPEEQLKKMYESQLNSQKAQLQTDYESTLSNLTAQQEAAQKATDDNIRRAKVEAQKAAVSNAEYYNAAGLSSGARAQARLSQENQLLSNLTALRSAQQTADAEVERQRGLLAKEYASAIQKAQSDNDLALAQALYEEAEKREAELLAKQEAAANLMAQTGDYSRIGALYGLTDAEIKKLSGVTPKSPKKPVIDDDTIDNGSRTKAEIIAMQRELGINPNGKWDLKSQKAAKKRWGTSSADAAWEANNAELYAQYQANHTKKTDNVNSFINRNMTREQAISRGIGETSWKAMILNALNNANFTSEEFAALEKHYGIG